MNKKYMFAVSIIAGVIALWLILKAVHIQRLIHLFSNSSPSIIILYILVSYLIMLSLTWRWQIVLKSQNIKVTMFKLFLYRLVGYGISYLTPTAKLGGEPVRAALLSRDGVDFSRGLSTVVIDKTIEIATSALFFFIGVLIVLFAYALPGETEVMMLFFAIVFLFLMVWIYHRMSSGKGLIASLCKTLRLHKIKSLKMDEEKLERFESMVIKFFQDDKKDFYITILASFVGWVLMFFEFKLAGLIIGVNLSFEQIFLVVSFLGAALMFPIPMGIGSMELSQVTVFSIINLDKAGGVALSFLVRARDLVWSIIGLLLLSYYGLNIKKTIKKSYRLNK